MYENTKITLLSLDEIKNVPQWLNGGDVIIATKPDGCDWTYWSADSDFVSASEQAISLRDSQDRQVGIAQFKRFKLNHHIGAVEVSTVCLGNDYETMLFTNGDEVYCERSRTKEQAEETHHRFVSMLEAARV